MRSRLAIRSLVRSLVRFLVVGLVVGRVLVAPTGVAARPVASAGVLAARPVRYAPPVSVPLRVVRAFDAPDTPYGPGHRGVDLDLGSSLDVLAAAGGTVSFAGRVAGRGVVVVVHADGIRTEYEPVTPTVRAGQAVGRGQLVGRLSGEHAGCPVTACLHWGARRGAAYLDPLGLLHPLGPVRLLPWDG